MKMLLLTILKGKNIKAMTDRFNALTVVLQQDIREDDAKSLIDAIMMIKGVLSVTGNVVDVETFAANVRANARITGELYQLINKINSSE
jgi:hypothetical protein